MSLLWADNYDIYGGDRDLMLDGFYAQFGTGLGYTGITPRVPSFDNSKYWLRIGDGQGLGPRDAIYRRVLGGSFTSIGFATRVQFDQLPSTNDRTWPVIFRDGTNGDIFRMALTTDGNLAIYNSAGTLVVQTVVPCIFSQTAHKIQGQIIFGAGGTAEVEIRVDGVDKIGGTSGVSGTGLTIGGTATQVCQGNSTNSSAGAVNWWVDFFVPYSLTGTYNDDWPAISGVATLWPSADIPPSEFTPRPFQLYGAGNLFVALDGSNGALDCGAVTGDNLGSADFTLEGWFRPGTAAPTTTDLWTFFGKWNETGNARSYRLVKYGPDINSSRLRWEVSTDGTNATLVNVLSVDFDFDAAHWYHIAVCRDSGVTRLFIDGIQIGTDEADANTYFAAGTSAKFLLGGEISGTGSTLVNNKSFDGFTDEIRTTPGVARYTANFTPPSGPFPRNVGGDPDFASVQVLAGYDQSVINESGISRTLTVRGVTARQEHDDAGTGKNYRMLGSQPPYDDRFLEAFFLKATNTFELTSLPIAAETITLGATTYEWVAALVGANDVLIGADEAESLANLVAAINQGPGEGTVYGTGTVQNASASAELGPNPNFQFVATALVAGLGGNSIVSTDTTTGGAWLDGATLTGGADIPAPQEFSMDPLPPTATGLRGLFLIGREFLDTDNATQQKSFVVDGNAADGADNALSSTPTYRGDMIEEDPDTGAALTPSSVLNGRLRITRTS
jgi:hypothetical protein